MARGDSGRIVLEVDPDLKREIYSVLDRKGQTLKEWFLGIAHTELLEAAQLRLDFSDSAENLRTGAPGNKVA